jgi:dihydrofolate synthase/folylpolyglutamate synthase
MIEAMSTRYFRSTDEVFDYLMGFVNVEKGQKTEFKLDRMRWLCAKLGDPQESYGTIHVAGSKGKGSVSSMIARILQASGRRTGLYTSPHVARWKERISLAGDEMPEETILAAMEEVFPLVDGRVPADFPGGELPTYFELTTLVGFCAFRRAGCDRAVIETGLGGRLDSTNIVASKASVITPIELEHTEWLGDTMSLIAFEKAGIVKPSRPCYASAQRPEALAVLSRVCAERSSELRDAPALVRVEKTGIGMGGTHASLSFAPGSPLAARFPSSFEARTGLIGAVQAQNMALALLAAAETDESVTPEAAAAGLARTSLPARFQLLDLDPPLVLDGAHTPNSMAATLESFETLFPGPKALLFACAHDKKRDDLAAILAPHFERITITRPGTFKQSEPEAVYESFASITPDSRLVRDTTEAVRFARNEAARDGLPLLVTGSFYLCAEALKALRP